MLLAEGAGKAHSSAARGLDSRSMTAGEAAGLGTAGISSVKAKVWDRWYEGDPPPWEIDKPQPVIDELAAEGRLSGRVLDVGCGTGEHTLLAAERGAQALGLDISPRAIKRAGEKARERHIEARFQLGDALRLDRLGELFDVVIDSGTFQSFDADERSLYVSSLANVVRPGGVLYLTVVSDREPGDEGPRRVSEAEIRAAFTRGWTIDELRECVRERRPAPAIAWLAAIRRTGTDQSEPHAADNGLVRTQEDQRRLRLENDLLEVEVIRRRLELARENGLAAEDLAPVVRRLLEGPCSNRDLQPD